MLFEIRFMWLSVKFFMRFVLLRQGSIEEFNVRVMNLFVDREIEILRRSHPNATEAELEAMAREAIGLRVLEAEKKLGRRY